jgi:phosphate-selective porin OprO/OprP
MKKLKNYILITLLLASTFTFAQKQEKKENPFSFKWDNGFKLESADKNFKLKFGGRIMVDHAFFSQNNDLDATLGKLETKNGTEFRRARLFTSGTIYKNVDFKLQIDFAGGKAELKDAYMGIKKIPVFGHIRVGHVKEPFRFDALTSSKYITFMERALPIDFMQERDNGIIAFNDFFDKKLSLQAGYFRNQSNNSSDLAANNGFAFTARATTLAFNNKEKNQLLHLGIGYSHRNPDTNEFRITSKPEAHLSSVKYISTGTISNVKSINLINFETVFIAGPFSFQGEYLTAKVNKQNTLLANNYNFSSYYGQISYFLTGEHKKYKSSYAGLDRVHPIKNYGGEKNGSGAWEVALRFSNSDLNDTTILGGEQSDVTLGLNWYLNPSTRVMFNNVWANIKDTGNANVFQVRFQIDF